MSTTISSVDNYDDSNISNLYTNNHNNKPIGHYFESTYNYNNKWITRKKKKKKFTYSLTITIASQES